MIAGGQHEGAPQSLKCHEILAKNPPPEAEKGELVLVVLIIQFVMVTIQSADLNVLDCFGGAGIG